MIDSLINNCKIEKAFLFDVVSKVYIATDSNPIEMKHYELCSELINVSIEVSYIIVRLYCFCLKISMMRQVGTLSLTKKVAP